MPVPGIDEFPLPTSSSPSIPEVEAHTEGARSFIALCNLTVMLGEILPLIYDLQMDTDATIAAMRRNEVLLQDWESSLPSFLQYDNPSFKPKSPGALSLHLSLLAVKMCICRVALQVRTAIKDRDFTY